MAAAFKRSMARLPCVVVCDDCVQPEEPVVDTDHFGDFSLCHRCDKPVTSKDRANFVRPRSGEAA